MSNDRVSALRKQLAVIAEEIDKLENRPKEPPEGSVIKFSMGFQGNYGHTYTYTYAALRVGSRWHLTGKQTKPMAWDDLLDWIGEGDGCFYPMSMSHDSISVR